jgi:hypothetical protein
MKRDTEGTEATRSTPRLLGELDAVAVDFVTILPRQ